MLNRSKKITPQALKSKTCLYIKMLKGDSITLIRRLERSKYHKNIYSTNMLRTIPVLNRDTKCLKLQAVTSIFKPITYEVRSSLKEKRDPEQDYQSTSKFA